MNVLFYISLALIQSLLVEERNKLSDMFGLDNTIICWGCSAGPGWFTYHHRNFHG